LRDAVSDAAIEIVAVLSPDRLARRYAYQVLLLEELARYRSPDYSPAFALLTSFRPTEGHGGEGGGRRTRPAPRVAPGRE